jgi:tRNA G10  N-methylase Trm11
MLMIKSILILGRQPALGLAEVESLYGAGAITNVAPQVAGIDLPVSEIAFSHLGGSTRTAHVLAVVPTTDWKRIERELPLLVTELGLTLPDGKIQLGLSAFGLKISPARLNAVGLTLKKVLRSKLERSVRVTPNPELELNTAQVLHNHLTGPTGIELLLVATSDGKTVIARTHSVQDIDSYSLRDRERPKRDAKVGMLPPKLAQILINLGTGPVNPDLHPPVILDPFCGTGVVLQEALLMGYDVIGTDLEKRMVEYSLANVKWLSETLPNNGFLRYTDIGDATTHQWFEASNIDVIAAETYLGRPFTDRPSRELIEQTASEVNVILKKFLRNIHAQLTTGTRLCLAVPAWQTGPHQFRHLPLIDSLEELGYNRMRFEHVRDEQLLYYREDQTVARQILVLIRK